VIAPVINTSSANDIQTSELLWPSKEDVIALINPSMMNINSEEDYNNTLNHLKNIVTTSNEIEKGQLHLRLHLVETLLQMEKY
jgi:hypothetical protein